MNEKFVNKAKLKKILLLILVVSAAGLYVLTDYFTIMQLFVTFLVSVVVLFYVLDILLMSDFVFRLFFDPERKSWRERFERAATGDGNHYIALLDKLWLVFGVLIIASLVGAALFL